MILSLSALSEPDTTWWLEASELTLVVSAIVLAFGLVGEWPDSESRKKRWLYKAAKAAVVLGVVGELIGDAGIFETSARLSVLQHAAIDQASTKAAAANERAGIAIKRAAQLEKDAADVRVEQERLKSANLALEQQIQPRIITADLANKLVLISRRHGNETIAIASYALDTEGAILGKQLVRLFHAENVPFEDRLMSLNTLGAIVLGVRVTGTDAQFADEIRDAFRSAGFVLVGDQPPPPATGMSIGNPNAPAPVNLFLGVKPL